MFTRGYKRDSSWVFFQTLQWPKQNAENGVIVRNLNYRPWQWIYIYSISGCKSFPGGF